MQFTFSLTKHFYSSSVAVLPTSLAPTANLSSICFLLAAKYFRSSSRKLICLKVAKMWGLQLPFSSQLAGKTKQNKKNHHILPSMLSSLNEPLLILKVGVSSRFARHQRCENRLSLRCLAICHCPSDAILWFSPDFYPLNPLSLIAAAAAN